MRFRGRCATVGLSLDCCGECEAPADEPLWSFIWSFRPPGEPVPALKSPAAADASPNGRKGMPHYATSAPVVEFSGPTEHAAFSTEEFREAKLEP